MWWLDLSLGKGGWDRGGNKLQRAIELRLEHKPKPAQTRPRTQIEQSESETKLQGTKGDRTADCFSVFFSAFCGL
jgi:hypothetical protein